MSRNAMALRKVKQGRISFRQSGRRSTENNEYIWFE